MPDIVDECERCLKFAALQISFLVLHADTILFNHRVIKELVWLRTRDPAIKRKTRPDLHIIDVGTRFKASIFVHRESASEIWNVLIKAWVTMYIGMPSNMLVEQGRVFTSDEWLYACSLNNIEMTQTGTKSHSSLGAFESYHSYLRSKCNKLMADSVNIPEEFTLAPPTKTINDSTSPYGLCAGSQC